MRTWKFGDNIDTDAIIPGRYLVHYDPRKLASHAFEGTRNEFAGEVSPGDIIIAGRNFGCGSSREHAPIALLGAGITVRGRGIICPDILPECRECRAAPPGLP